MAVMAMIQWLNIIIITLLFPTVKTNIVSSMCGDPLNITVPLSCDADGQWIHVIKETYGAADLRTNKCSFVQGCPQGSLTSSQYMLRSSCNGPAPGNGTVCEEDVKSTKEMLTACGLATATAKVDVSYRCVPATAIINLCDNFTWTINMEQATMFLATPFFSNPPLLNINCTCEIRGIELGLQILDFQADVDPAMADPLTIRASSGEAWNASGVCKRCYVEMVNENVFRSGLGRNYTEFKVNFQDNHKAGQRAWLEIQGLRQNITVSCRASTVTSAELISSTASTTLTTTGVKTTPAEPTPRTLTTTTTAGTAATTAATASVKMTTTTTTAGKVATTTLATEALSESASGVTKPAQTSSTVITSSRGGGEHRAEMQTSISKDNMRDNDHNVAVPVILILLAIVLTVAVGILGLLVWRRYQQIGRKGPETYTGHSSCKVFSLVYWYHCCHSNKGKASSSDHQTLQFADLAVDDCPHGRNNFSNSEEVCSGDGVNHNGVSSTSNTACNATSADWLKLGNQEQANNLRSSADIALHAGNGVFLQSDNGVLFKDQGDNRRPNRNENHKNESSETYSKETDYNQFQKDKFGNVSAMSPQEASLYRASNKILQNETEDASGELSREMSSPKSTFYDNLDNMRLGGSTPLKQNEDEFGLKTPASCQQDALQENVKGEKGHGTAPKSHITDHRDDITTPKDGITTHKKDDKERSKSLPSLQQKSKKGLHSLDTPFCHEKGSISSENLAEDEDLGEREMASHPVTSHDASHTGIQNLEAGFHCDTVIRREMGFQDSGEDTAESKMHRNKRNNENKRTVALKNRDCLEKNQHDRESRKNKAEKTVARILGQTLQHITAQRENLFSSQDQSEA